MVDLYKSMWGIIYMITDKLQVNETKWINI